MKIFQILTVVIFAGHLLVNPPQAKASLPTEKSCDQPANPIVAENCLPGTGEWEVKDHSYEIMGFASQSSVEAGSSLDFFVTAPGKTFDLRIYRLGYYGGLGGRLIFEKEGIPARLQPPCRLDAPTGLRSCSNWEAPLKIEVPAEWVSGVYVAKFTLPNEAGENYTVFVVRQDSRNSEILYQQSFTTFHAYNNYGDKSLYSHNSSPCQTDSGTRRAVKVSFDRPYNAPMGDPSTFFRAEYPMVRWLEAQGYDLTYSTNLDTHRAGLPEAHNELLDHRVFLSVGHDEYWTKEMRTAITQARDNGVHLGFFSANTGYWKIRLEADPWTGAPDRVMVGYKTTESGGADPSGEPTTTWRDPQGANLPENELLGIAYIGDNDRLYFPLRVSAEQAADPIYRNTGLQGMPAGSYVDLGKQLVGWEWDAVIDNGYTPKGLTILATSPVSGGLLADAGRLRQPGGAYAHTTRYLAPSGAIVFASGTIQWSWGLDVFEPDRRIQQITYNLLADMGVQPVTPAPDIVLDGQARQQAETNTGKILVSGAPVQTSLTSTGRSRSLDITWETDQPALGQVWVVDAEGLVAMPAGTGVRMAYEESYTNRHFLTLDGLAPGTDLHFVVLSTTENGFTSISEVQTVRMPPASLQDRLRGAVTPLKDQVTCTIKPVGQRIRWQARSQPALAGAAALAVLITTGIFLIGMIRWVKANRG